MSSPIRQPRPVWRPAHGILLLDKPAGLSSNQALQQARRLFAAEKAGHTGSLDPLATGLLPLCFGEATKIAGHLLGAVKAYRAEIRLGVTTTTADAEGEVLAVRELPANLNGAVLEAVLVGLRGRIVQVPPVYSALKQDGLPLYVRARRGEAVQAPPREVDVHRLELEAHHGDRLMVYVECGSGTYVRSLATDLGERLGCGAHLTTLRRLWVDPFRQPVMHTLDALAERAAACGVKALDMLLLPVESGLSALPRVELDAAAADAFRCGRLVRVAGAPAGTVAVFVGSWLLGLGEVGDGGRLGVRRGLNLPAPPGSPSAQGLLRPEGSG